MLLFGFLFLYVPKMSTERFCCCSVTLLYLPLCTPGLTCPSVSPELAQTHVHWVGDAIQPSHPLLPPSAPALNLSRFLFLYEGICFWQNGYPRINPRLPWTPIPWPWKNEKVGLLHFWHVKLTIYLDHLRVLLLCVWSGWKPMRPQAPEQQQQQGKVGHAGLSFSSELKETRGSLPLPSWGFSLQALPFCRVLTTTTTTKSFQSCPTLCNPIDGSPPGFPIPGILQARILEWVAISFSLHPHKTKSYLTPIRQHPSYLQCVVSTLKSCDIIQINLFCLFVYTISGLWSHRRTKRYTLPHT